MKIEKHKKSEKGFAIALALIMLLVMSLMGATLVMVAANDHKKNATKDSSQQAFYAAETGITEAKKWLADPKNAPLKSQSDPSSNLKFCKTSSFSNLSSTKAINDWVDNKELDKITINHAENITNIKDYSSNELYKYLSDRYTN